MAQQMVGQHQCQHRLPHRDGADADAGIMPPLGHHIHLGTGAIDALAGRENGTGRLHREARDDRLTRRNPTENAAGMVGAEHHLAVGHPHLVGIRLAAERGGRESIADLHALHRIDAHQCARQIGIELAVDRRAEPRRHAFGDHLDHRAAGGAGFADLAEILFPLPSGDRVGAEERVALHLRPVPPRAVDRMRTDLHQGATDGHLATQHFPRDGSGCHPHRGFPSR